MKLLIKIILLLAGIFTTTLLIIKFSGILTVDDIKESFLNLKSQPSYVLGSLIVFLLFIDLFIAVPTMSIIILSGYFLGFELALLYTSFGLLSASMTGYFLSKKYGNKVLDKLSSNKEQKLEMTTLFNKQGILVIILSRAVPMLPEICSCLAGTCKMPIKRFLLAWTLGTIPYVGVMSYAGSISNLDEPMPAILAALGITVLFWLVWIIFMKIDKKRSNI
jgi:uncharacterized membrane protein YdjX (TVP38/TMEM64 family)